MAQGALAAKWLKGRSRRAPLEPTLTYLDASLRFKSAQPALLYLVPGALGAALLTAAARGEISVCPAPPPSLLLPLPVSLLYTHSLPPYCCPYPCPYCTLTHSLPVALPRPAPHRLGAILVEARGGVAAVALLGAHRFNT